MNDEESAEVERASREHQDVRAPREGSDQQPGPESEDAADPSSTESPAADQSDLVAVPVSVDESNSTKPDPSNTRQVHYSRPERSAANARARRTARTRRLLFGTGVLFFFLVEGALLYPRFAGGPASPSDRCVSAWNAAVNGQVRRDLNVAAAGLVGTPRQQIWLGSQDGRCTLTVVLANGDGRIYRHDGRTFRGELVQPLSESFDLPARSVHEPNCVLTLVSGRDLLAHPEMGSVEPMS